MTENQTAVIEAFAELIAAETDPDKRSALFSKARMLAMSAAPAAAFEPPIRTLGEYLDTEIELPPVLIHPFMCVRGGMNVTVGRAGKGKEQPVSARVLTPTGWKTMGEIAVGDRVSNPITGLDSAVTGVFPQGNKPIYRLTFSDGAQTEAGLEHLWEVEQRGMTSRKVVSTQFLIDGLKTKGERSRFAVPCPEPIEFAPTKLPVDPYALGLLIGDGTLASGGIRFTSADPELPAALSESNLGVEVRHIGGYEYRLSNARGAGNPLLDQIRVLGLDVLSDKKRVPEMYLRGSVAQRLALLQGLMDTDGCADGEFCSKSKGLVEDVIELTRSLGGLAALRRKRTSWTHNGIKQRGVAWRTTIRLAPGLVPFRLERKASKSRRLLNIPRRYLQSIEYVRDEEAVCIMVDHYRHLYVTDDYVVTHNTVMNLNRMLRWSAGLPWFDGWEDKDGNKLLYPDEPLKILIVENEGAAGMFHKQVGDMLSADGYLTDEQRKLARENIFVWGEGGYSNMKLDDPAILNGLRKGVDKWKPDMVFIEPFRSLWKGEENSSTEMNVVVDALVGLATDYNCGVWAAHHEKKGGHGEDDKMSAARGSTVLEGVVTVMENFESTKGGEYREVTWSKSRHGVPPNPVMLDWDPAAWWYNWVPTDQVGEDIYEALRGNIDEPMSVSDLVDATDYTRTKLNAALKTLVKDGKVKKMSGVSASDGSGSTGPRYRLATGDGDSGGGLGF